ncbi:MAG TPA: DinB family protein [Terriglobales bacterium]|nr:DinB family protein [Terriglobales bacterium]
MSISQALLGEFDLEMANTRKVLERVPLEKADWKPHLKSGNLGWLAGHVANLPEWVTFTLNSSELDLATAPRNKAPESKQELLETFEKKAKEARAAIANAKDQQWSGEWSLKRGGQTLFTMPRAAVVRGFALNHLIHHRGQLTVYLRLIDVPIPGLYGPSADEK